MSAPIVWAEEPDGAFTARVMWGERFADCTIDRLGGGEGWWASVVVPRPNGSTQPPSMRMSAHCITSHEAAKAWCERAIVFAQEVMP